MGIGLVKGGRNIRFGVLGKISMGWVTTPLIACLLTFVMLFFVQNVFEQPVVNKIYYQFNRAELIELENKGINLNYLTEVNGREYQSARALNQSLNRIKQLTPKQKLILTNVAEVQKMKIDYYNLKQNLKEKTFSANQWATLLKLNEKYYSHKWQLEEALIKLSPEWKLKPKGYKNQIFNDTLKSQYHILENLSKVNEEAPADSLR